MRLATVIIRKIANKGRRKRINQADWATDLGQRIFRGWELHNSETRGDGLAAEAAAAELARSKENDFLKDHNKETPEVINTSPEPTEEKPRRTRRTKAEMENATE